MSAKLLGLGFSCDMGTPCRKLVLLKLIDACDDDGNRIFPAVATIARAAQCSARQVQRELSTFVRVGLLVVVREGGKGPGNTREYRMDVDVLRRIEAAGWDATFGAGGETACADKGDRESPLDDGGKGDTGDMERVTPATDKGDRACHPTPQTNPQTLPQEARAARERGEDGRQGQEEGGTEDPKRIEAEGWALLKDWPKFGPMPKKPAMRAWMALSADERADARRLFSHWLAMLKAAGKTHTPAPATYFGEKLWRFVPEPEPDEPQVLIAAPFGPVWGAMVARALLGPATAPATWPVASAFQQRLLAQDDALGRRERLGRQARYGWPGVNAIYEQADRRRGVVMNPADEALKALVEPVPVISELYGRWRAEFERRGWPWIPDPGGQKVVYLPAGGPAGLEAFEAAVKSGEGYGNDERGREAAE
jgi:hypothetical protein